jgi:hypothetical protein
LLVDADTGLPTFAGAAFLRLRPDVDAGDRTIAARSGPVPHMHVVLLQQSCPVRPNTRNSLREPDDA